MFNKIIIAVGLSSLLLISSCGSIPCPDDTEDIGIGYCIVKPSPTPKK